MDHMEAGRDPVTLVAESPAFAERRVRPRALVVPLSLYAASRVLTLVATAVTMALRPGTTLVQILGSWDGSWYALIVRHGYPSSIPVNHHGKAVFSQIPFFPAYPLLVKAIHLFVPAGPKMIGIVLTMLLGGLAAVLFWYVCRSFWGDQVANRCVAVFCFIPGAWVLSFAYSEGLMLLLSIATLLLLQRRSWLAAGLVAALATSSRPNAIVLVACAAVASAIAIYQRREWRSLIAPILAPLGAVAFMGYLWERTGDLDAWFRVQHQAWGERTDFGVESFVQFKAFLRFPLQSGDVLIIGGMTLLAVLLVVLLIRARLPVIYLVYALGVLALSASSAVLLLRPRFVFVAFPLTMALGRFLRGRLLALALVAFAVGQVCLVVWYGHSWTLRGVLFPFPP
jgi:hypothetical protein